MSRLNLSVVFLTTLFAMSGASHAQDASITSPVDVVMSELGIDIASLTNKPTLSSFKSNDPSIRQIRYSMDRRTIKVTGKDLRNSRQISELVTSLNLTEHTKLKQTFRSLYGEPKSRPRVMTWVIANPNATTWQSETSKIHLRIGSDKSFEIIVDQRGADRGNRPIKSNAAVKRSQKTKTRAKPQYESAIPRKRPTDEIAF